MKALIHIHTAKLLTLVNIGAACLMLLGTAARAQVINFDVPGGVGGFVNYSGQGAVVDTGNYYWNVVVGNGTTTSGLLSDGVTASPITLMDTYGAGGGAVYTGDGQGANGTPGGLFSPFEDNKNSTFNTNTLNNVPAGTYNLYLYGDNGSDADRGTVFTVWTASTGASSLSTANLPADSGKFVKGVNYVEFTNLTLASAGTINIAWTANTAVNNSAIGGINTEGIFNGLQLIPSASDTNVPPVFPEIIVPSLNTNEIVVAATTPQQYGAKGDGITDDSAAFQAAINAVYNSGGNGGGVVYVPAGNYAFYTNITIQTGVTLHGNWKDWTKGTNGCVGTTFKVYYGAGNTNAPPFIQCGQGSSLKGVNIWYPNQNPNSITPYPFTISLNGVNNSVVQNVVLVNSYLGIEADGDSEWIVSSVIGSPLCLGLTADSIADICQTEDIRFNPNIWAISKLTNAPAVGDPYATWMRTNGIGIQLFRIDGLISMNTEISGYNYGLDFELDPINGAAGACFYNGHVTNCAIAMNAQEEQSTPGLEFSYFTLDGDIGVSRTHLTNDATVHFDDCTIIGRNGTAVYCTGANWSSVMAFQNCTISNTLNLAGPGVFNLVNCSLSGSTQCVMSASATRAAFTGCTFSPTQKIVNNGNVNNLIMDSRRSSQTDMPIVDWTNVMNDYVSRKPAKTTLFVATSYGATGNGVTDDTAAINAALTAAGTNGGGIVYLPAGNYKTTTTLSVPSGVELRGAYELRHGTWGGNDGREKGAIINPYGGAGTTNGPPAVALAANSGLVGMTFNYPNQNTNNIAYPPTIQGRGGNVYIIGVQCAEAWNYVDLDTYTCTNHFLYMVDGWALNTWVRAGNGSSGTIADTHGNPTYWIDDPSGMNQMNWDVETTFGSSNLQAYALGNCTELFAKVFVDCEKNFMHCSSENGQGPNVTAIGAACDGTYQSYVFDATGPCTLTNVNSIWWCPFGGANPCAILSTTNFTGTVRFLNVPLWGGPRQDYEISGGDIGLELVQLPQGSSGVQINGGVFHLINASIDSGGSFYVTYGANSGIAGKTNEFIGCYAYSGCSYNIGNVTNAYSIWNDYALNSYTVTSLGPVVVGGFYPNGAYQFQPSSALTFQADSANGINTSGITVQLSGTNLLGQSYVSNYTSANGLTIGGSSTARTVSAPLVTNAVYKAVIKVTDASGNGTTNTESFDTINPAYTFEAEDFDYNSGSYIDNPQTNAYAGLVGISNIDYVNSNTNGSASYRPQGLETEGASDVPRLTYSSGLPDYNIGFTTAGNWGNYTRSFPSGTYNIYMRSASPGSTSDSASMSLVTGGRDTSSQTTSLMGTFSAVNTGGYQTYAWVPLKDGSGNFVAFTGGSVQTLRVTTDNAGNNINCYMLIPTNAYSAFGIGPATNFTLNFGGTPIPQGVGVNWNTANNWSDGNPASVSAVSNPGSTYEVIVGSRLRSPTTTPNTFPGVLLKVDGSGVFENGTVNQVGELRFKHNGVPATNSFPKLVMNGGQIDQADDGLLTIMGEVDINSNTPIYVDNGANSTNRPTEIRALLAGNGSIEYHSFSPSGLSDNLKISGSANTYSGTWNVVQGALLGTGNNALGTNTITVGSSGALETTYDINNPNGSLILNGQMFLHQNDTFRTVSVNGEQLAAGTYPAANLSVYTNFPATWTPQLGSTFSSRSGQIVVLGGLPPVMVQTHLSGSSLQLTWSQGTLLSSTNVGGPYTPVGGTSPYNVNMSPNIPAMFYKVQTQKAVPQ